MSRFTIGRRIAMAAAGAALLCGPASAQDAESFPSGPIEVVIHTTFGGGTDTTARMMAIRTRRNLDNTDVVIVSKPGGGGAEAQNYVMSKPADGQTVIALTQTHLYTIARGQSQMTIDDIVGVARAMDEPTFITVGANSQYETIDDLIEASKEGPLNWGISVIGSTEHIGLAQFAKAAGIEYKVVPFGSGGEMVQALLSGAIDAILPNVSEAATQIDDGSMRALLVMRQEPLPDYPDVPTSFEKGWEVKLSTTRGYAVRAGTPQEIIDKLSEAMVKAMQHETFANYLATAGLTPDDSVAGSEEWDQQLKEEYQVAREVMIELGLIKQ